ncbi:S8 family serine peptidase [Halobacillus litoralis]|uniref:S8 family serine peptidase n=1 Tax=Halobacillus litoralis TaxID=45668 RepID=UPI001CFE9060|nr:S8 family serine peptidase [Halobacillus litoralis]
MKSIIRTLLFLLFIGGWFLGHSSITYASGNEQVKLIVKYKDEVTTQSAENEFPVDIISTDVVGWEEKVEELKENPAIEYIEVDTKVYAQGFTPNDPYYIDQEKTYEAMKAPEAWTDYAQKQPGDPVVAVIDSGVNKNHPDLEGQLVEGTNLVDSTLPPQDTFGHGSHVAGLIAANTDNGLGVSSLSLGDVKIMPIKIMEENSGNVSDVIEGIRYAVEHGADVINLSLGTYTYRTSLADAVDSAVEEGVLVVAAAGNNDRAQSLYPAALNNVLSVGSYDLRLHDKASFSNYGVDVDVVTPGTELLSTYLKDDYKTMEGTSMSTGHVSSLASLLKNHAPFLRGQQLKRLIEESSRYVPAHFSLGEGMVDAKQSIENIRDLHRISGPTSIQTSTAISQIGWNELDEKDLKIDGTTETGKFVILATGRDFPDSLAASPLASYLNSPVLLEKRDRLSVSIEEELERLKATDVVLIGGANAISEGVEDDLETEGYHTYRVSGSDRYETAIAVNRLIPYETNKAFIISGQEFPDALSAAGYSGMYQYPIVYVRSDSIPDPVQSYMEESGITKTYIVGGTHPVSEDVESRLPDSNPLRIAGKNRYETNRAMHRTFGNDEAEELYFATGRNFPDGMAVAPLAVQSSSPIILTQDSQIGPTNESVQLFDQRKDYSIIGGTQPISIPLAWEIDRSFYQ